MVRLHRRALGRTAGMLLLSHTLRPVNCIRWWVERPSGTTGSLVEGLVHANRSGRGSVAPVDCYVHGLRWNKYLTK